MINLALKVDTKRKAATVVHKELLCHFSPFYLAALKDGFREATLDVIEVDVNEDVLQHFVGWLYTGQTPSTRSSDFRTTARPIVDLYVFAEWTGNLALRRSIMNTLVPVPRTYRVARLVSHGEVATAFEHLPEWSPLRKYMVDA